MLKITTLGLAHPFPLDSILLPFRHYPFLPFVLIAFTVAIGTASLKFIASMSRCTVSHRILNFAFDLRIVVILRTRRTDLVLLLRPPHRSHFLA